MLGFPVGSKDGSTDGAREGENEGAVVVGSDVVTVLVIVAVVVGSIVVSSMLVVSVITDCCVVLNEIGPMLGFIEVSTLGIGEGI